MLSFLIPVFILSETLISDSKSEFTLLIEGKSVIEYVTLLLQAASDVKLYSQNIFLILPAICLFAIAFGS